MPRSRRLGVLSLSMAAVLSGALLWWLTRPEPHDGVALRPGHGGEIGSVTAPPVAPEPGEGADLPVHGAAVPLAPSDPGSSADATSLATTGSLAVQVRWKADGSPAADIRLRLIELDRPDPLYHVIEGTSDASGGWALKSLSAGRMLVSSDRLEQQAGIVAAGQATQITIDLLPGVLVRGLVVDGDEHPVPGAEIWLDGAYTSPGEIWFVGRSDNRGRFSLRDIRNAQFVGASAPGYTRSPSVRVREKSPDPFDITLVLGPPGGHVRGVVVDSEGRPVAAATVLVGSEIGWPLPDSTRTRELERAAPFRLVADERGEFLARDVPVGTSEVTVRATGWSPWSGSAEVHLGETAEVRAALRPSASVTGVVRDESGQPVADVHVGTGSGALLKLQYAFSDADGRFALSDLPLGRTALAAFKDGGGRAQTALTIEPGGRYTWDPVLARGLQIKGRVVNKLGEGLAGYRIEGVPESGEGQPRQCTSEHDGRFSLTNCDDVPHRVEVRPRDLGSYLAVATVPGARPGQPDLEIVVDPDQGQALVIGRLQDAEGRPVGDPRIGLYQSSTNHGSVASIDPSTGAFRIGPVPPGPYFLHVEADDYPDLKLPEFQLGPDEVRDLGVLAFAAPATILVRVTVPEGIAADSVGAALFGLDGLDGAQPRREPDGSFLSSALAAGEYRLKVWAKGAMAPDRTLRVAAGQRLELDVALAHCVPHTIQLSMPLREGPMPELVVEIRERDGPLVIEERPDMFDMEGRRRAGLCPCLPPADYNLRVRRDGNLVLDVPLAIEESGAERSDFDLP